MASENTKILRVASELVETSHRWIVSGTPAKDLIGVELDMVGPVSHAGTPTPSNIDDEFIRRDTLMSQRKLFNENDEKVGAVRNLGSLASGFLKIRPWCSAEDERGSDWINYFFRHEMLRPRTRTFSGFSKCLRQMLESTVIRTQLGDVERDIELPPLTHEIVRLEPSFYDKLTVNAFVFVLTSNAVTSERTDIDYIFHKKSGKERYQLLNNLRASAFYWTGFSPSDMAAAIEQSQAYFKKQKKICSKDDQTLLECCIDQAKVMIGSEAWKNLTKSHEVGLFVENWPTESAEFWSFDGAGSYFVHRQDFAQEFADILVNRSILPSVVWSYTVDSGSRPCKPADRSPRSFRRSFWMRYPCIVLPSLGIDRRQSACACQDGYTIVFASS
jgi:hypothetical protein